jgi:hypothetical protein
MHLRRIRHVQYLLSLALVAPLLALIVVPWTSLSAAQYVAPWEPYRYYPATGHNLGPAIKPYYDAHGGLAIFGLPLTELFAQDGMQVQYFERARFELRPDQPAGRNLSLTLLGSVLSEGRRGEAAFAWLAGAGAPDRAFFPESGHTLGGAFQHFWKSRGGLPIFGYPISEEFSEVSPNDGNTYLVQYFERARFEYHSEHQGTPYEVMLGQFGREYARVRGLAPELLAPVSPVVRLAVAATRFSPRSPAGENIRLAARKLDGVIVGPGQTLSFMSAVGEISARTGFVEGLSIVGGALTQEVGGGICQVSTTLYQAAFSAGLEISERHSHSRMLSFFEDTPGMEAAVYTPDLDLRWRNDTPYQIYIATEFNAKQGVATVSLWGVSDGRTTTVAAPLIRNKREPGPGTRTYDPTLPAGEVRQVVHARSGMDVVTGRLVRDVAGNVIRRESIVTHYDPWEEVVYYG